MNSEQSVTRAALAGGFVVSLWVCAVSAAPPLPIARVAPAHSFLIAEIADVSALKGGVERSALGDMWRDPGVKAFLEHVSKEPLRALTDHLATIDSDLDDLVWPTGRLGLALYLPESGVPAAPDAPMPDPHVLIVGEFGDQAQKARDLMGRFLEKALDEKRVEVTDDKYQGVDVSIIKPVDAEKPEEDDGGDEDMFEPEPGMAEQLAEGLRNPPDIYQAWIESTLVVASDMGGLEAAIDASLGRAVESVESSDAFRRARSMLGHEPAAYAVVLTGPLADDFKRSVAESAPVPFDPTPVFDMFGLSAVEGLGMSLRAVDTPDALSDFGLAVLAREKKGLLALLATPLGAFDPPAFVGPDVSGVMSMTFRFDGLLDTLRAGVDALPEEQRQEAAGSIEQVAGMVGPALAQLGPRLHVFSSYERPLTPDSQRNVFAIEVRDELPVSNTLLMLSNFVQMEPRDFEGHTIYSGDTVPIAAGLGFGHVFFGPEAAVENALRAAGNPDGPRLGREDQFRRATAAVPPTTVLASFSDLKQDLQWFYYTLENFDQIQAAMLEGIEIPQEQKEEILASLREDRPDWVDHLPPLEVLTRVLGPMVYEIHDAPDGFEGSLRLLKAP